MGFLGRTALLSILGAAAQISFQTAVQTEDCCTTTTCGLKDYKLNFPTKGRPGFSFSITGNLPKDSQAWHLELQGTVEGVALINASVAGCGKVSAKIGTQLVGTVEIDFPPCPVKAGPVTISGKVNLHIPIPYGFGAAVSVRVSDGPAKGGPLLNCENVYVSSKALPPPPQQGAQVVVAGDSWGTFGAKPFQAMFTGHGSKATVYNMAAGGTTSADWSHGPMLENLVKSVSLPSTERLWLTFGGNDAIFHLPFCAMQIDPATGTNKTIDKCTDELVENVLTSVDKMLAAIKAANPKVRVVGFGYDIMGLSKWPACPLVAPEIMPQCWNKEKHPEGHIHCFNQQFLKIQGVWDSLSNSPRGLGIVDTVTLLGTLQALGGDKKASVGHPDLDKFGPSDLWQVNCIHPSEAKGFPAIFDKFWDLYWSKQNLTAAAQETIVV